MTATAAAAPAGRSLGRIMTGVAPAGLFVQLCSFASSVTFAHVLGATAATDGYYLGISIPVLAFGLFVGALRQGAIPALTDVDVAAGRDAFETAGGELLRAVAVAAALVTAVAVGAAEALAPLVAHGEVLRQTRLVMLEQAPYGVSGAVVGVLGALLAVRGVFVLPVAVVAAESLLKITLLFTVGDALGVQALVIGNLGGSAVAIVLLVAALRRHGVRLGARGRLDSPFVRRAVALGVPVLISLSVLQVNPVIDRTMATGLGHGKVTALELGLRLFLVPAGLVTGLLISPITATWAARYATQGATALVRGLGDAVRLALLWAPPAVVATFALRRQVAELLFSGDAYPQSALRDTASVLGMIVLSLPAQALTVAFATLFVVQKDTRFPLKIALANVVLNAGLNLALRPPLGVAGIALSTTLTYTLLTLAYAVATVRRWGGGFLRQRRAAGLALASAAASAAVAEALLAILPAGHARLDSLLAIAVVAAGVGLVQAGVLAVGGSA